MSYKTEGFLIAVAAVLIALILARVAVLVTAQERVQSWTYETCYTNACIKATLDKLSPDRAHDAKLTTWGSGTYVWYRQ